MPKVGLAVSAVVAATVLIVSLSLTGCAESSPQARSLEHLSPVYTVDRVYRSMTGPSSTQTIFFPQSDQPELAWITGYRATIVGEDGDTPMSQEFMCHSNLDYDAQRHARLFDLPIYHTSRLFTLSQGQFDIKLPEGFGLPYYTDEEFTLTTQVLNLNPIDGSARVRHKVAIDYILDRDVDESRPMKPLFMTSGWGLVLLEGDTGHFGVANPTEEEHGAGCLPGDAAGHDNYTDAFNREFSGHWVVRPGREENSTLVTNIMKIPYDTTVHYIAVHLHPFAESLTLIDMTTGETVFKSEVDNSEGRVGIDRVEYFASVDGVPVYKDHEYELVSVYNNTTNEDQDSMAVMLLYLRDAKFKKKHRDPQDFARVAHIEQPVRTSEDLIMLHTDFGDIQVALYPTVAPKHVEQLFTLARLKVLDGVYFSRVEPGFLIQTGYPSARGGAPLSEEQQRAIRRLQAEFSDLPHRKGTVSMVLNDNNDPHSAEASFFIVLDDSTFLDGKYTVVGHVAAGMETLDRIAAAPLDGTRLREPIRIESAEVLSRAEAVARR